MYQIENKDRIINISVYVESEKQEKKRNKETKWKQRKKGSLTDGTGVGNGE